MEDPKPSNVTPRDAPDYDVAIVGASLAGCATAILLARAGARVALIEKRPDAAAFKRVCSHYIQSSAVPTLERLGLMEPMLSAGAVRSRIRTWTPWGWIVGADNREALRGINLRREMLDPLIRRIAAETAGVELILGRAAESLIQEDGSVCGVSLGDRHGGSIRLRARLVVGADGRDSCVAKFAEVRLRTAPHGRFAYGGYFEGPMPCGAPDASAWMVDPQWAVAFPTDSGLTFYGCMLTKDHLTEFRGDPAQALVSFVERLPDAPPIRETRLMGRMQGKLEMPNLIRRPIAPGLALVGDAALATDPLFGVGCGWALQSAAWLADSVAPALSEVEPLAKGLRRYRRRHSRALRGHAFLIHGYATGRSMTSPERFVLAAAARNPSMADALEAYGSKSIGPARFLASALPTAAVVNARHLISRSSGQATSLQEKQRGGS